MRGQDYNNNLMAIGLINKLYIDVTRIAIDKKEMSCMIAFWFCGVFKGYLKPL
jgi:hypothetical protein